MTGYAQELDEIRIVRMAMVQRQEALSVRRAPPISNPLIVRLSRPAPVSWAAHLCLLLRSHRVMLTFELQELLASEEKKLIHKPKLDRERNSVAHLSAAKADCEGIMTSFTFHPLLLVTTQI